MEQVIAVSACLLGFHCRFDGGTSLNLDLAKTLKGKRVIPICPEQLGGLPTPRIPAEIMEDGISVFDKEGHDVTAFFERGMKATLLVLQSEGCHQAILKDGSPSCGCTTIHDGSFTGTKIPGEGFTCRYLKANGIQIMDITEEREL